MPFQIVRNDITKMAVDAIVNAAKPSLLGGGGVDGAIHTAAGAGLLEECKTLGGCKTGESKISCGYNLPCKYVIHTVGPVWHGGFFGEKEKLTSCYNSALELAKAKGCESIAFPLISAGAYGYPKDKALKVAVGAISEFLIDNDMTVYLVVYGSEALSIGHKLFSDIQEYIDDNYVHSHPSRGEERRRFNCPALPLPCMRMSESEYSYCSSIDSKAAIDDLVIELDESFQQMLLRKIDEKGLTDAECYKKANIDRKLFSKIRKDVHYKPSKTTAIAFAIALELNLSETRELLTKAGYALSHSYMFDVIIEYFIVRQNYNIFEINEALFYYDQNLLGA